MEFNNIHHKIQFTAEEEIDNQINFLDLSIYRTTDHLQFRIFRKPTATDIMIHNTSCYPTEHKTSGINYLINRIITYPISEHNINKDKQIIYHLLKVNGYHHRNKDDLIRRRKQHQPTEKDKNHNQKKWANFADIDKETRLLLKLFEGYNINISFRTRNTLEKFLFFPVALQSFRTLAASHIGGCLSYLDIW
jgi:hypothetical protein